MAKSIGYILSAQALRKLTSRLRAVESVINDQSKVKRDRSQPVRLPFAWATITAVNGAGSSATYDATTFMGPAWSVTEATPVNRGMFGTAARQISGEDTDIVEAQVGDLCRLFQDADGVVQLEQLTEEPLYDDCGDTGIIAADFSFTTDQRVLGRYTAGAGAGEEVTVGSGLAISGGGTLGIQTAGVTSAMLRDSAAVSIIGRSANSTGVPADIAASADGHVLRRASGAIGFGALVAGDLPTIDHGSGLTGLSDDDHSQYAILAGRSGGQTLIGGTASGNSLTLKSSSHPTKGNIELADLLAFNIVVGSGTTSQQFSFQRSGDGNAFYIHKGASYEASIGLGGLELWWASGLTEQIRYGTNDATYFTNTHTMRGQLIVYGANTYAPAYRTALIVRGISGMTADLQEWQNSSSVKQAAIGAAGYLEMVEQSAPSTPASGYGRLYPATDNTLRYKDDAGAVTVITKPKRIMQILVSDPNGDAITTGDGKAYFRINSELNGYNISAVAAHVTTVSSSGIPTVQIANVTDSVDLLSTKLTIDASEKDSSTAATAAVINTSNDDVATGDEWRIDIDVAGTGAKGLIVEITFEYP